MGDRTFTMVGGNPDDWGFIPTFLDLDDPRPAAEQFQSHYIGGWNPFEGFTFDIDSGVISYPEDPPMKVRSCIQFRDELILLFDFSWVLIMQPDLSWQISRMD